MFLEVDEGFYAHRKTLRFCALMQNTEAWSHVLRLWGWACRSSPGGGLSGMKPAEVEIAMGWHSMDGRAYGAAVEAGFIDEDAPGRPAAIHGWTEHTGAAIKRMQDAATRKAEWRANKGKTPREPSQDKRGTVPGTATRQRQDEDEVSAGQTDTVQSSPVQSSQGASGAGARDPWRSGYEWRHAFGLSWAKKYRTQSYGNGGDGKAMGTLTDDVLAGMNDSELVPLWAEREKFFAAFLACTDEKLVKAKHPFAFFVARFSDFRPDLRRRAAVAALPVIATAEKTSPEARGWAPKEKRLDVRVPGDGGELERIEPGKEAAS